MVDEFGSNKRESVLCKLDMKKDFDNVNWDFVDYMLGGLNFRDR